MSKKLFQDELYELTMGKIEKVILLFHQLEIPISEIPDILFECVALKPQNAELYISFYSSILPSNNEKLNNLMKFVILQKVLNIPLSSEIVFFLFLLFESGILSLTHINQIFTSVDEEFLPLFLIFLPELYQYQNENFKNVASALNINIEQNINDQWKQFKIYRHLGQNPDPLLTEIRKKNHQEIENLNAQVPYSIFERVTILKRATYSEYLVYFNHPDSLSIDFKEISYLPFEKLAIASIYGSNLSFFSKYFYEIQGYENIIDKSKNKQFIEMEENYSDWTIEEDSGKEFDLNWKMQILAEPNYHVLTSSEINNRIYSNKDCCLRSLNNWAYRQGFKFVKNQSTKAKVLQLRCYLGKRHKSSENDNDKDSQYCNFKVSISERKDLSCKIRIQDKNSNHNHQLNPSFTQHFLLPNEIIETIKILRKGTTVTTPGVISKYVQLMTGIVIKANQIEELSNLKIEESINSEAQDLIDYLWSTDGKAEIIRDNGQIIGVLAFSKNELNNIEKYGEVISFERIEFQNRFKWKSYIVYGVDSNFELISFGTFFLVNNDVSKIKVAFEIFLSFISIRRKPETLITGIDKEMIESLNLLLNASEKFNGIKHVINSNDIINEFQKNLFTVNEDKKKEMMSMFEKVVFSESETVYQQNFLMLINLSEKLCQFIKKTLPNASFYARSIIGSIKTFGLNYISLKKNLNNLISTIFLDNYVSLIDCKKALLFDSYSKKFTMIRKSIFLESINNDFDIKELPKNLGDNVIKYILDSISKIDSLEASIDDTKTFVTINDKNAKEKFIVSIQNETENSKSFNISCSCQSSSHIGLPCCHLYKAYQVLKRNDDDDFINHIPLHPWSDISNHFIKENAKNQSLKNINSSNNSHNDEDVDVHYKRYDEMMNVAKETAKLCILSDEDKNDFISLLQNFASEKINKLNKSIPIDCTNNPQINDLNS